MAQIVQLKRSSLSGKVPDTGSLNLGELAINTYDGKIYLRRSGSTDTVQEVITTNVVNTGSIFLTGAITASIAATNGVISGSSQITTLGFTTTSSFNLFTASENSKFTTLANLTSSYATTGSNIFSGSQTITGSIGMTGDLTVLGAINARQFNIGIISSSVIYQSGSTKFGDTGDDVMQVTGSLQVSGSQIITGSVNITGSIYVNGTAVGIAPGPNTYDFNLDPNAAGTVNYITDSTSNTLALAQTGSFDVKISNITRLSVSSSAMWVTTGSITSNYMHLAKYINTAGDLDFNI
jgi:hypothetical protein